MAREHSFLITENTDQQPVVPIFYGHCTNFMQIFVLPPSKIWQSDHFKIWHTFVGIGLLVTGIKWNGHLRFELWWQKCHKLAPGITDDNYGLLYPLLWDKYAWKSQAVSSFLLFLKSVPHLRSHIPYFCLFFGTVKYSHSYLIKWCCSKGSAKQEHFSSRDCYEHSFDCWYYLTASNWDCTDYLMPDCE